MIAPRTPRPLDDPAPLLSRDRLRSLAGTYDSSVSPIWIRDVGGEYIYANSTARETPEVMPRSAFDILDHNGRTIGRLETIVQGV